MSAVIFTYPPDYAMAAIAARSYAKLGVRPYLAIDHRDPVPAVEGAEIVRTRFPRRGNLNGKACVEGILRTMAEVADGDEYQFKGDSDTVARSLAWLDGRTEPAVGLRHTGYRGLYGACYALRTDRLDDYRQEAAKLPHGDRSCSEDVVIGEFIPGIFTYENLAPGCPFAAYSWKSPKTEEEWRQYQVLVFQRIEGKSRTDIRDAMLKFS